MVLIVGTFVPLHQWPVNACGFEDEVDGPQECAGFFFEKLNIFGVEVMYTNRKYPASNVCVGDL